MASVLDQLDGEWRRTAADLAAARALADVCLAAGGART